MARNNTAAISLSTSESLEADYLELQVNSDTKVILAMANVKEVLNIEARTVVPVPNMPPCFLGLLSHRNRAYWVVSLALLLNLPITKPITHNYSLVIFQFGQTMLALLVSEIQGVVKINSDQIQPISADRIPSGLFAYAHTCIVSEKGIKYVIDPTDLSKASVLRI